MLLAEARGLLYTEGLRQKLAFPNQLHATTKCCYISRGTDVKVMQSIEHASAFYAGLVTCGSVWSCPVCSSKIQERRRAELEQGINWAYANGLQAVMVTLTTPHKTWQTMEELLDMLAAALAILRKGASYDKFKIRIGYEGMIRALETKYGKSGWHNHTHELMIVDQYTIADTGSEEGLAMAAKIHSVDVEELRGLPDIKSVILKRWENACRQVGLLDESKIEAFRKHAVDVKGWCSASDYLAKQDDPRHWGIDRELAKANNKNKSGAREGLHPFGLLANALQGDELAGNRFVEFSMAIRGRAQLFWSRGLKAKVGIVDQTDTEIVEREDDNADCLGWLSSADWAAVRAVPGATSKVLDIAESRGWIGVRAYVDGLKDPAAIRPPPAYGELRAKAKESHQARPPASKPGIGRKRRRPLLLLDDIDRLPKFELPKLDQGELEFSP